MVDFYDNVTTTLFTEIGDTVTSSIRIIGLNSLDLRIGDYLMIDEEIVRISHTV